MSHCSSRQIGLNTIDQKRTSFSSVSFYFCHLVCSRQLCQHGSNSFPIYRWTTQYSRDASHLPNYNCHVIFSSWRWFNIQHSQDSLARILFRCMCMYAAKLWHLVVMPLSVQPLLVSCGSSSLFVFVSLLWWRISVSLALTFIGTLQPPLFCIISTISSVKKPIVYWSWLFLINCSFIANTSSLERRYSTFCTWT